MRNDTGPKIDPVTVAVMLVALIIGGIILLPLTLTAWAAIGVVSAVRAAVRRLRRRHVPGLPADGEPLNQREASILVSLDTDRPT
jgi:hypothetical protein